MTTHSVYCDESCHLERDHQKAMVLGAVWCPSDSARSLSSSLRSLKTTHGMSADFEIKWTKVSPAKLAFYLDVIDYFFATDLRFRGVVVPDKSQLRHEHFDQDHDTFYYKTYYLLLRGLLEEGHTYRVFLDFKDTRGREKVALLRECLCNSWRDFSQSMIPTIQLVRSDEVQLVQLTDLLIGALSYLHRGLTTSRAKLKVIQRMQQRSSLTLRHTTGPHRPKVDLLVWKPRKIVL